jgi:hypothetical protein
VSDQLRSVGMRLGVAKTFINTNVVEGSIKPDKLAGIDLQDLGESNAQTLQKQLLRLHSFGRRYPNSGALRRLLGELHSKVIEKKVAPDDLTVQVAIATEPRRVCRRLQLLSRMEHHEQNNEQVFP